MKTFYFIAGMPRSCSTLLCNILAQNPDFHATHTSGCMDVLFGLRNQWDHLVEHKAHPDPAAKLRVQRAILEAYYADIEKPIVFDKCRGWLAHLEMAEELLGRRAKVLVPVRSLPEIVASMEVLHRETAKVKQPPGEAQNYFQFQTIEGRADYWTAGNEVIGLAFNRIRDAILRGFGDRLHFVHADALTGDPEEALRGIYEFLEEPYCEHDFANVHQLTHEEDGVHGYVGLHQIRPRVCPLPKRAKEILGANLFARFMQIQVPWEA